ncbi:hypothetical protein G3O08_09815 [Cryomorpha ignava]|uniref:Erythromycin esterase family protein n=1 Tax=Cryomorpha ignava TaxID=101383 RepID=A0A7K3WQ63_9FLAO|nr:hypothetical protein [Cryomorpha ignava]NEN23797.1 hypothetical protein [Cryomorpha ignava]
MVKLILSSFLLFLSLSVFSQEDTISFNRENPPFLDSTIADFDVFLTAEVHWGENNSSRKKKMIEYLSSNNSLDVIVVERSYAFGLWVNYFLESGDSLFLKEFLAVDDFFSTVNGVVYDDEYEFYSWLRNFKIENNLSIQVIGIDMASFWFGKPILWSFLKFTDRNQDMQELLATSIENANILLLKEKLTTRAILKWYRKLKLTTSQIEIVDQQFSNYLFNLQQSVKWSKERNIDYRENEIAANFTNYIAEGQKVYGQFGMGHTMLQPEKLIRSKPFTAFKSRTFMSFAYLLNQDEYYKDKILSIGLVCFNCDRFNDFPGPDLFYPFLTYEDFERLKSEFLKLSPNTLIDLRKTNEKSKHNCQLLLIDFE